MSNTFNPVRTSIFKTPARSEPSFALIVESYDLSSKPHKVIGRHYETNEVVSVSLSAAPPKTGTYDRPEIADFSKPRKYSNSPGIEPGGIMFIQEPLKVGDKEYSTRWITALSHHQGEANIMTGTAYYDGPRMSSPRDGSQGSPYCRITILYDGNGQCMEPDVADIINFTSPFMVDDEESLRETLIQMLQRDLEAGIRIVFNDAIDATYIRLPRERGKSVETAVKEFFNTKMPDNLTELINEGASVEIIPFRTFFLGKKTAADDYARLENEKMTFDVKNKRGRLMAKLNRFQSFSDANGSTVMNRHFGKCMLTFRVTDPLPETGERLAYYTSIEPLFNKSQSLLGLRDALIYAQTPNFKPKIVYTGAPVNNFQENTTANREAPEQGEDYGSDHSISEDDAAMMAEAAMNAEMLARQPKQQTPAPVRASERRGFNSQPVQHGEHQAARSDNRQQQEEPQQQQQNRPARPFQSSMS